MQIAVIDLGVGNLRSVAQAVEAVAPDADVIISGDAVAIERADRIVLPGQGAIGTWFSALQDRNLEASVRMCLDEKPVLGICVGMQAMFERCDEGGSVGGLGLYRGSVQHFSRFHKASADGQLRLKIPQMGWNQLKQTQEHPLWHDIANNAHFYFVHSYCANMAEDANNSVVLGTANYGHEFVAAVGADNVFAVQFHPEKSHADGLQLLRNFTQWNPN